VDDLEPPEHQGPLQEILEDVGPPVADVGVVVDGRPAGVELDDPGLERDERLHRAAEGVEETDHLPP